MHKGEGVEPGRQVLADGEVAALVGGDRLPVHRDLRLRVGRALEGDRLLLGRESHLLRGGDGELGEHPLLVDLVVEVLHEGGRAVAGIGGERRQGVERVARHAAQLLQVDHLLGELLVDRPANRLGAHPVGRVHHVEGRVGPARHLLPPLGHDAEPRRLLVGGAVVFDHHEVEEPALDHRFRVRVAVAERGPLRLGVGAAGVFRGVLPHGVRQQPHLGAGRALPHGGSRRAHERRRHLPQVVPVARAAAVFEVLGVALPVGGVFVPVEQDAVQLVRFREGTDIFSHAVERPPVRVGGAQVFAVVAREAGHVVGRVDVEAHLAGLVREIAGHVDFKRRRLERVARKEDGVAVLRVDDDRIHRQLLRGRERPVELAAQLRRREQRVGRQVVGPRRDHHRPQLVRDVEVDRLGLGLLLRFLFGPGGLLRTVRVPRLFPVGGLRFPVGGGHDGGVRP